MNTFKRILLAMFILALITPKQALGTGFVTTVGSALVTAQGGFALNSGDVLTMQAQIVGCSGNLPLYQGVPVSITPNQTALAPITADNSEVVNFIVPGNDVLMCGGQNYSMYAITWKVNGFPVAPTKTYRFTDNTVTNLNLEIPIGWVPPVITNNAGFDCPTGQNLSGFDSNYQPHCSAVVTTVMPIAGAPGVILTNPTAGNNYQAQPGVFFSQPGDTIASIEAQCASTACTYVVTQNQVITLAANHTLSSNVSLDFWGTASWTINGAFTLTLPNAVKGSASPHFLGAGTTKFGSKQALVPVEWFGAINDGTTDDTAAIQEALNSLTVGQIQLQLGSYKISSALTITRPGIGIKGVTMRITSPTIYSNPPASIIVSNSATADIVDVTGVSSSNTTVYNKFEDFNLERSAVPGGTAAGLSLSFTYGVMVSRVGVQDSIRGFYIHASGSQGTGYIDNSSVTFGYNGVTETAGNLYGIYVDSADGQQSASFRVRNSFVANNGLTGPIVYGAALIGTQLNDQMFTSFETAGVDYGVYVHQTGFASAITSSDIHFVGGINDGCRISCYLIQGLTAAGGAGVEISGGYLTNQTANPLIDIEQSSGVHISGVQFGVAGGGSESACVDVNQSSNISITGNLCQGVNNTGILLNLSTAVSVVGNILTGLSDANGLITLTGSGLNAIVGNALSGTGKSLVVDVNSNSNTGLSSNTIQSSLAASSVIGSNPLSVGDSISGQHYISLMTPPTAAALTAAGTGATASVSGTSTDAKGLLTLNAQATGGATGAWVTVTFNKPYTTAPVVVLTNGSNVITSASVFVNSTTTSFTVWSNIAPTTVAVVWNYVVIG